MIKTILFLSGTQKISYETFSYLVEFSKETDIRYYFYTHNNRFDFPDYYDIGISFLYCNKVPKKELKVPWINFHPGPLPKYKGRNLAYHAIMNDELQFGATMHYMNENFDTGPIIEVEYFDLLPDMNAEDVVNLTHKTLFNLFKKHIHNIINMELPIGIPQSKTGKYYYKKNIDNEVQLTHYQQKQIRAVTIKNCNAVIKIGTTKYNIIKEN